MSYLATSDAFWAGTIGIIVSLVAMWVFANFSTQAHKQHMRTLNRAMNVGYILSLCSVVLLVLYLIPVCFFNLIRVVVHVVRNA